MADTVDCLVHHQSLSQIASGQRSQPIADTSIARIPAERAVFLVSDRHSIAIAHVGFPIADPLPLELYLHIITDRAIGVLVIRIAIAT